ncbi:MAG TPA: hypothetical protein VGC67_13840 [Cellulomonas sp.]
MLARLRLLRRSQDAGMSLVELLVYSVLLLVVVAVTGSLLISSLRTQRSAIDNGQATSSAQVAFADIERAVRNASEVQVYQVSGTGFQTAAVGASGNLLITKTRIAADGGVTSSWRCARWYYDSNHANADGTKGALLSDDYTPVTTSVTAITLSTAQGWGLVLSSTGPASGASGVFTQRDSGVALSLGARVTGSPSISLESTVSIRTQNDATGSGTCLP